MKHRYMAALLAAFLLLGVSGCGSKPSSITPPDQIPATEAFTAEFAEPETESTDASEETGSTADETAADTTSGSATTTTAAAAAAGTPPAQLADGTPEPVTIAVTIDPKTLESHPDSADDDQMGNEAVPPAAEATQEITLPDKPAVTVAVPAVTAAASTSKLAVRGGSAQGKLQISIPTAEVTVDQLKANDYKVDLLISLDKNPGITYSEWGLNLDRHCTYTADSKGLPIQTIYSISDKHHFLWTAWTSGLTATDETGGMLTLHVTLPRDAKSGSSYPVTYADTSLKPAPHIWQSNDSNWVASGEVGWVSGGVVVK